MFTEPNEGLEVPYSTLFEDSLDLVMLHNETKAV